MTEHRVKTLNLESSVNMDRHRFGSCIGKLVMRTCEVKNPRWVQVNGEGQ